MDRPLPGLPAASLPPSLAPAPPAPLRSAEVEFMVCRPLPDYNLVSPARFGFTLAACGLGKVPLDRRDGTLQSLFMGIVPMAWKLSAAANCLTGMTMATLAGNYSEPVEPKFLRAIGLDFAHAPSQTLLGGGASS